MFNSCPFNLASVRYFPSTFAHMDLCGIHYQWLWLNCCKGSIFADIDAINWDTACRGPNGTSTWPRSLQAWTINSLWLVKREVVIPSCQSLADWLKSSMTPSWLRLTTKNFRDKTSRCGIRKPTASFVSKNGVFSPFSWLLNFCAQMTEFLLPVPQLCKSRKRIAIQIQLMNFHGSGCKY